MAARDPEPIRTRLYIIGDEDQLLGSLGDADLQSVGDIASILITARQFSGKLKDFIEAAQTAGIAVLHHRDNGHVKSIKPFDGIHLEDVTADIAELRASHPEEIIGIGGFSRRHDSLGAAEKDADYIAFGRLIDEDAPLSLEQRTELVTWWAEFVETPCVVRADTMEEASILCDAGCDFLAASKLIWGHKNGAESAISELNAIFDRHFEAANA